MDKLKNKIRSHQIAEPTIDADLETQRRNLLRIQKLLSDVLTESSRHKDLRTSLGEPLSILSNHVNKFFSTAGVGIVTECGIEYAKASEIVNISLQEYTDNLRGFLQIVDDYKTKCETFKKRLVERDALLVEYDLAKQHLKQLQDKQAKHDKLASGDIKHQLARQKYETVNEKLYEDIDTFYKEAYVRVKVEYKNLVLREISLFTSVNAAYKRLSSLVDYQYPSEPKTNIIEKKKPLSEYLVDDYVKEEPADAILACQICKQKVPLDYVDQHSEYCSSIVQQQLQESAPMVNIWRDRTNLQASFSRNSKDPQTKQLIRAQGIPVELRPRLWPLIMALDVEDHDPPYAELLRTFEGHNSEATWQIDKDLARTFPNNAAIQSPDNLKKLRNILVVYSFVNPQVGYCQSMNYFAALLLLYLSEEEAFWALSHIIDRYLPANFYTTSMIGIVVEQRVFKFILDSYFPKITSHLKKLQFDIEPIIVQWFMCLFLQSFSDLDDATRVFELFLYDGTKILYRLGLALFKLNEKEILKQKNFGDLFMFLSRKMVDSTDFRTLLKKCYKIKIKRNRIDQLREIYLAKIIIEKEAEERRLRVTSTASYPMHSTSTSFMQSPPVTLGRERVQSVMEEDEPAQTTPIRKMRSKSQPEKPNPELLAQNSPPKSGLWESRKPSTRKITWFANRGTLLTNLRRGVLKQEDLVLKEGVVEDDDEDARSVQEVLEFSESDSEDESSNTNKISKQQSGSSQDEEEVYSVTPDGVLEVVVRKKYREPRVPKESNQNNNNNNNTTQPENKKDKSNGTTQATEQQPETQKENEVPKTVTKSASAEGTKTVTFADDFQDEEESIPDTDQSSISQTSSEESTTTPTTSKLQSIVTKSYSENDVSVRETSDEKGLHHTSSLDGLDYDILNLENSEEIPSMEIRKSFRSRKSIVPQRRESK